MLEVWPVIYHLFDKHELSSQEVAVEAPCIHSHHGTIANQVGQVVK